MNSPTHHPVWHGFAQGRGGVFMGFAMEPMARHCFRAGQRLSSPDVRSQRCYPSPSLRSGPSQAGPFLVCGVGQVCARDVRNCFEMPAIAVESAAITTNQRGSTKCRSRLSSSLFSPCRSPVACRTRLRAGQLVLRPVSLSPTRPTATCLRVRSLAVSQVWPPAASSLACRPATRVTNLTAFGRVQPTTRTIRADCPGGPFAFRLGGADV
jgi:hypothetical protein